MRAESSICCLDFPACELHSFVLVLNSSDEYSPFDFKLRINKHLDCGKIQPKGKDTETSIDIMPYLVHHSQLRPTELIAQTSSLSSLINHSQANKPIFSDYLLLDVSSVPFPYPTQRCPGKDLFSLGSARHACTQYSDVLLLAARALSD